MKQDERELLISCGKAIQQLENLVWITPIPKDSDFDFDLFREAMSDIDYALRELESK